MPDAPCAISGWCQPGRTGELSPDILDKLPLCKFVQITGGEPFVRSDIWDVIKILRRKSRRVLINTNGYYTDRILTTVKKFPDMVFRISIDGERETHNRIGASISMIRQ